MSIHAIMPFIYEKVLQLFWRSARVNIIFSHSYFQLIPISHPVLRCLNKGPQVLTEMQVALICFLDPSQLFLPAKLLTTQATVTAAGTVIAG